MSFTKIGSVLFLLGLSQVHGGVVAPAVPVAPAVRYINVAPPNVAPFAAQVSTFTKGLPFLAAPFAAGVAGPALVPRPIGPAPLLPAPLPYAAPVPGALPFAAPAPFPVAAGPAPLPLGPAPLPIAGPAPYPFAPAEIPFGSPLIPNALPAPLLPEPFAARSVHALGHPAVAPAPFLG